MFLVDQAILTVESVSVLLHFQGIKWQEGNLLPRNTENSPIALCLCTVELYSPVQVSILHTAELGHSTHDSSPRVWDSTSAKAWCHSQRVWKLSLSQTCSASTVSTHPLEQHQYNYFLQAFIWMFNGSAHRVLEYDVEWIERLCSCLVYSYGNTIIL